MVVSKPSINRDESIGLQQGGGRNLWAGTFPEQFETLSDAEKFMERCLLLGVSQILQSRKLLPEKTFRKRVISDICRCWTPDQKHFTGARLLEKLRGAAEAMRKKYLNEFIIVVSTNEKNHHDAIEVFTWSVEYQDNKVISTFSTDVEQALMKLEYTGPESVKKQTFELLLRIRKLCRQVLQALPTEAFPTFRITYTNGTPRGYQAQGFYRSSELYDLDPKARSMTVAGAAVPHFRTVLSVSSVYLDDEFAAEEVLNNSLGFNDTMMDTSFGAILSLNETVEQSRSTPLITMGERVAARKRNVRGAKVEPVVQTRRRQRNDVESNREVSPLTEASELPTDTKSPGKSFKLDRISPGKESDAH